MLEQIKKKYPKMHTRSLVLFVGGSVFYLFYLSIWPLIWHLVILPKARPDNHQLRVESYFPHRVNNTFLFLEQPNSSLSAYAVWQVSQGGFYHIKLSCDDNGKVLLDNRPIITLKGVSALNVGEIKVWLTPGPHFLELRLFNGPEKGWLRIEVAGPGQANYNFLNTNELSFLELGNIETWIAIVFWGENFCLLGILGLISLWVWFYFRRRTIILLSIAKRIKNHFALNQKIYIFTCLGFLIFLKIWLTRAQSLLAFSNYGYDDLLFPQIANELLNGEWLGPYNHITLVKGPFYPLWIAMVYILNLPLLLAQQLLYIAACLMLIKALHAYRINPIIRLSFFAVLLFNPMTYTYTSLRVLREGIYPALTLLVVASAIGLITRIQYDIKKTVIWAIGLGIFLSAFWLTREEGLWIFPTLGIILGTGLIPVIREWRKKIGVFMIPLGILALSIVIVSTLNYHYYRIFSTVEFKAKPFLNAYGALCRVKHTHWIPDVPVPKETRLRIYQVSPTFAELKPFLEGKEGDFWLNICGSNEIDGGFFVWAFRHAVARADHHTSGENSMKFYQKIANEINGACNAGQLECYPKRSSMMPIWHSEYLPGFVRTIWRASIFMVRFEGLYTKTSESIGNEDSLKIFRDLTRERLSPIDPLLRATKLDDFRLNILKFIGNIYQILIPWLFLGAIIIGIVTSIKRIINFKNIKLELIAFALFAGILTRIFLLALISITSFDAISTVYLAPTYPLVLTFIIVSFSPLFCNGGERRGGQGAIRG